MKEFTQGQRNCQPGKGAELEFIPLQKNEGLNARKELARGSWEIEIARS
ncbi:hypothetical protein [Neomoorella mulderi]|nr:hypothetical protein [Moorella mulderi]